MLIHIKACTVVLSIRFTLFSGFYDFVASYFLDQVGVCGEEQCVSVSLFFHLVIILLCFNVVSLCSFCFCRCSQTTCSPMCFSTILHVLPHGSSFSIPRNDFHLDAASTFYFYSQVAFDFLAQSSFSFVFPKLIHLESGMYLYSQNFMILRNTRRARFQRRGCIEKPSFYQRFPTFFSQYNLGCIENA